MLALANADSSTPNLSSHSARIPFHCPLRITRNTRRHDSQTRCTILRISASVHLYCCKWQQHMHPWVPCRPAGSCFKAAVAASIQCNHNDTLKDMLKAAAPLKDEQHANQPLHGSPWPSVAVILVLPGLLMWKISATVCLLNSSGLASRCCPITHTKKHTLLPHSRQAIPNRRHLEVAS